MEMTFAMKKRVLLDRKILHIDMDAFFASVEQHDNPGLRGKPVIVGADPRGRGVVSTCSYEARKFGVHSAQPIKEAYRLCPKGIFLPVRGSRYAEVSRNIMQLLSQYTPLIEPLSLDEAFLDLTASQKIFGTAESIGRRIVLEIENQIGLSASVGIAPNKFLAKLASDLHKPHGFVVINPENANDILETLGIEKLWGVGPKTAAILHGMGIKTIGMLRQMNPQTLADNLGEIGLQLYQLAYGHDERPVSPSEPVKSVGHEMTFQVDTDDNEFLTGVLLWLCDQVARRLRQNGLKGRVITIKLRDGSFKTLTKRITLEQPTDFEETIYQEALKLFKRIPRAGLKIRLIGVSVSDFEDKTTLQLGLFSTEPQTVQKDLSKLHHTLDQLKDRFGEKIITKGTILQVQTQVGEKHDPHES
jgi:DNA polymerase-4